MRTNAWIVVERTRARRWRDWERWRRDPELYDEPAGMSNFEKKAVRRLGDMEYIFKRFLRPTILGKVWILLSVYDVTESELAAGYTQLGDAAAGGDFAVVGAWQWRQGQQFCQWWDLYAWAPNQVLQFMPPTYDEEGNMIAAVGVRDVNVLFGQPPREFPV